MQSSFLDVGVVSFYRIFACPLSLCTILSPKNSIIYLIISVLFLIVFSYYIRGDIRGIIISGPYCLIDTKLTDIVFADTKLGQHWTLSGTTLTDNIDNRRKIRKLFTVNSSKVLTCFLVLYLA